LDAERDARLKAELAEKKKLNKIEAEQRKAAAAQQPGSSQSGSKNAIKSLPTVPGTSALAAKASVMVFGLSSTPAYNGRVARVVGLLAATGRYKVSLHDGKELSLKRDNLKPISAEQAACVVMGLPLTETLHLEAGSLKTVYKALALKLHPDHNPGDVEAENAFKEMQAANQLLRNFLGA
jgi:hypothetical protein